MKRKANEPKTLQQAIRRFSDEEVCVQTIAAKRWPSGPFCPKCGDTEHYYVKTQRRWQCKGCKHQYSVKVGTIFEDSAIPLNKWLVALWMLVNCRNGVSSYEVARAIGVTQKSAWFVLHRLRWALRNGSFEKLGQTGGPVEADETFVGPNPMKMHKERRQRLQRKVSENYGFMNRTVGKTIVMGMLDRDARKIRANVVPDVRRSTLQEQILKHVKGGATVYTDEHSAYKYALVDKFAHEVVNHMQGYVVGKVHTQDIENFWSLLKRSLRGTYVAVEPFHLDRYVDEQVFRYNNRKDADNKPIPDAERFALALAGVAGKRLTFAEVTGKTGSEATN